MVLKEHLLYSVFRIREASMENRVLPIHAESHTLPYAEGFFDCSIRMDSYQYYGTGDLYLGYFHKFVKPGGEIGIVVPALHREFEGVTVAGAQEIDVSEFLAKPLGIQLL